MFQVFSPRPLGIQPPLTIVVPVKDGAETLPRCLEALAAAAPDGAEIIVVDDGSSDDSAALAEERGATVVHHEHNRGTSAARNTGARHAQADIIAFVDADVVVHPDALHRLLAWFEREPDLLGVNGILSLAIDAPDLVTAFVNTSIHYQHLRHGPRVASAFTSICALRRSALEAMGGWDERWFSRYGDDVATRFHLPPASIRMDPGIQGEHLKANHLRGLLKHRFNIGSFFTRIGRSHAAEIKRRPGVAILHARYPLNTVAAAGYCAAAASTLVLGPLTAPAWLLSMGLSSAANARFALFTLRHRGPTEAAVAIPLSALEGFAYLGGMVHGLLTRPTTGARS